MRIKALCLAGSLIFLGGFAAADQDLVLDPPPQKDLTLDPPPQQERQQPTVEEMDEQLYNDMMNTGASGPQNPNQVRPPAHHNENKLITPLKPGQPPKIAPQSEPSVPDESTSASGFIAPGSSGVSSEAAESGGASAMTASGRSAVKTAPAAKNAQRIAQQLKKSMSAGPGDMPGGGPQAGAALKPQSGSDPANPQTQQDLALASMSGYGGSFTAFGLRAGKGPTGDALILRSGGEPATPEELAKLREHIAGEPTALMRRPDFYTVLPRDKFQQLKEAYRSKPDLRETAFKHVEMNAAERDFQRSASCEPLSGGCNPATASTAYRKGDLVPPEDLSKIHKSVEPDADDLPEGTVEEAAAPKGAEFNGSAFDAIYAKLNGLIGSIKDTMGIGDDAGKPSEPSAVAAGSSETGWAGYSDGESKAFSFSEPAKPRAAGAVPLPMGAHPRAPGAPVAAAKRVRARRALGFGALSGTAFLLFAIWRFRRKKSFLQQQSPL